MVLGAKRLFLEWSWILRVHAFPYHVIRVKGVKPSPPVAACCSIALFAGPFKRGAEDTARVLKTSASVLATAVAIDDSDAQKPCSRKACQKWLQLPKAPFWDLFCRHNSW